MGPLCWDLLGLSLSCKRTKVVSSVAFIVFFSAAVTSTLLRPCSSIVACGKKCLIILTSSKCRHFKFVFSELLVLPRGREYHYMSTTFHGSCYHLLRLHIVALMYCCNITPDLRLYLKQMTNSGRLHGPGFECSMNMEVILSSGGHLNLNFVSVCLVLHSAVMSVAASLYSLPIKGLLYFWDSLNLTCSV